MKNRGRSYYAVRSFVRFVFWTGASALVVLGASQVSKALEDDTPKCNVVLNSDFSWDSANGSVVNVYSCKHPRGVVLGKNGTWDWAEVER